MAAIEIWTSAAAVDGYIRTSQITTGLVAGVRCCDALDVDYYDGENYRDDFFSTVSSIGNTLVKFPALGVGKTHLDALELTTPDTPPVFDTGELTPSANADSIISGTDPLMHVPPRNEQKKRTLFRYWTGPFAAGTGTGNVVAAVFAEEGEMPEFSSSPFAFI